MRRVRVNGVCTARAGHMTTLYRWGWARMTAVLTLSRKHWKNHFMVYRLVKTSCLSCSGTHTHQHTVTLKIKLFNMRPCGVTPSPSAASVWAWSFSERGRGAPGNGSAWENRGRRTLQKEADARAERQLLDLPRCSVRPSYRAWRASVQTAAWPEPRRRLPRSCRWAAGLWSDSFPGSSPPPAATARLRAPFQNLPDAQELTVL